ncbi:hypothetical protein [Thermoleptolyngbya sp. M55_K2018_002]|uniref:hypothetical protein n=1 Tax=Thermoleptolyngbya sp. M55_K2018_002 TaxID=2747808 RepID=UPI0019F892E4|nr:hypothetical protein [Thermoleptolyngbya sp. M55_K2018_002]HIK41653.1 hypothetical protein [Thermoleptolyngbya sp. M55_K2018_002]
MVLRWGRSPSNVFTANVFPAKRVAANVFPANMVPSEMVAANVFPAKFPANLFR